MQDHDDRGRLRDGSELKAKATLDYSSVAISSRKGINGHGPPNQTERAV